MPPIDTPTGTGFKTRQNNNNKSDQIIHHIYCKSTQLITNARIEQQTNNNKHDKWFNLELQDPDYFKEELKTWKSISSVLYSLSNSSSTNSQQQLTNYHLIPVLIFEIILDIQALPPNSFLTLIDSKAREHTIDHRINQTTTHHLHHPSSTRNLITHKNIVIERWSISLIGPIPTNSNSLEPPTVYRHSIIHFRALYSYLRTMPASTLFQKLKKNTTNPEHALLKIGCRISTTDPTHEALLDPFNPNYHFHHPHHEIGIFQDLTNSQTNCPPDSISTFDFPSIQTPRGSIKTRVIYRNHIEFRIGDKEKILSSHFRYQDQLEPPLKNHHTNPLSAFYRTACSKFTRSGVSAPNSTNSNIYPSQSHYNNSPPDTNLKPNSISPNLPSGLYSSNYPPLTSYGSLSSRHLPAHRPPSSTSLDHLFTPVIKPSSDPLTADILAATESSPFGSATQTRPTHHGTGTGNSSALTAKLAAHPQLLPPVMSNALPGPSSPNRSNSSSTTAATGGNSKMAGSNMGASPRQFSILSSSPRSGPSSSIRISSGRPQPQQIPFNPAHLLSAASPTMPGGSSGSSYPLISGPLSPLPTETSQRSVPPGQPMMRRYSSSRHSRSFGQASSSGGTSLHTGDSGGSLGRRALLNSYSGFDEHHRRLSEDSHRNDINQFLKLIDSSQIIPSDRTPTRAHQWNRPAHLRYQRRTRDSTTAPKNEQTKEQDAVAAVDTPAAAIEEENNDDDDDDDESLSQLMKEKLDLTLKKLAGSVLPIPEEPFPITEPYRPVASGSRPTPYFGVLTGLGVSSNAETPSGPADGHASSVSRTGKTRSGSFSLPPSGLATLQRLREEDEPLEPPPPTSSPAIELAPPPHSHQHNDDQTDLQLDDHKAQPGDDSSNQQLHIDQPNDEDVDQQDRDDETDCLDPIRIEL